jgi:hypothetical protein
VYFNSDGLIFNYISRSISHIIVMAAKKPQTLSLDAMLKEGE